MTTNYSSMTPEQIAQYLQRYKAYAVIGVLHVTARHQEFRGKINLGLAVSGRNMRNSYLARPVESALAMGAISEWRDGAAFCYSITERGREILDALKTVA